MTDLQIPRTDIPRVVIIGGGFGGIAVVKTLNRCKMQIVLLDRNNYHLFQPLLYQVSTAGLEPDSIAFPLRGIFRNNRDFYIRMAEAWKITPEQHILETSMGSLSYDYMVIATGSYTNFFGMGDIEANAVGMKSLLEAVQIRSHILHQFEQTLLVPDNEEITARLCFVITGGGPTGVELSGAIAELKKNVLPKDYPELPRAKMKIYLVEAGSRLLAGMSEQSSRKTLDSLQNMGVEVLLGTSVKAYDGKTLTLSNGQTIRSHTVIWSAGVKATAVEGLPQGAFQKNGRVLVNEFNQVEGLPDIYAIGDIAFQSSDPRYPKGHPMVAQVAIQQGRRVARNLLTLKKGNPMIPFHYKDKGTMSTIGRNKAVAELHGLKISGLPAWLTWMAVHLVFLMGFRNKLIVFMNWMYRYFTYDRGSRIIFRRGVANIDKLRESVEAR